MNNIFIIMLNIINLIIIFKYEIIYNKHIPIHIVIITGFQRHTNTKKPGHFCPGSLFYSKLKLFQFYFSTSFF